MTARTDASTDYLVLGKFRHELRRFVAFSERLALGTGLEPQQQQLLLAVKALPAGQTATIGALAARLLLRHHSVVELVDRLDAKGLIARTRSQADRRQVVITLTAAGERKLEPLVQTTLREIVETGPRLLRALEELVAHAGSLV